MPRADKNETAVKVLRYVKENEPVTSKELFLNMNMTKAMARRILPYYHSNSYINRTGKEGKMYKYVLGDNGEERLEYLEDLGY